MHLTIQRPPPEMAALKEKLKAAWTSGDFGRIAESFEKGAVEFVDRLNLTSGMTVLDVGCGTGNQSIPAARTGAEVIGIDIAPNLLERARQRAAGENLTIRFDEGDAEDLPYRCQSFDVVLSMFGAMFAPRPDKAAAELVRVCSPGGTIAMANWTPAGFVGQMFEIIAAYVPPPANMSSPLLWGIQTQVRTRFGGAVSKIQLTPRFVTLEFPFGVSETIEYWRRFYGPVRQTFAALERKAQAALRRDLEKLWSRHNLSGDASTCVKAEYLEVVAVRSNQIDCL